MHTIMQHTDIHYNANFIRDEEEQFFFGKLLNELTPFLTQKQSTVFGKTYKQRRLCSYFSTAPGDYVFSGQSHTAHPVTPVLSELLVKINRELGASYDSVFINLYRNMTDKIDKHADDEPFFDKSDIASLSLGCERDFVFHDKKTNIMVAKYRLKSGDLVRMTGECQSKYVHSLPARKRCSVCNEKDTSEGECGHDQRRLNLTFHKRTM
jgi:alkylated DNA repair dioxygenase AlkB